MAGPRSESDVWRDDWSEHVPRRCRVGCRKLFLYPSSLRSGDAATGAEQSSSRGRGTLARRSRFGRSFSLKSGSLIGSNGFVELLCNGSAGFSQLSVVTEIRGRSRLSRAEVPSLIIVTQNVVANLSAPIARLFRLVRDNVWPERKGFASCLKSPVADEFESSSESSLVPASSKEHLEACSSQRRPQ